VATVLIAGFGLRAEASVISVVPASQNANVGDVVNASIVLSGLTAAETVGSFAFLLSFNEAVLNETSYSIGVGIGAAPDDFTTFGPNSPLDFWVLANLAESEIALKAAQGAAFTLATVSFNAVAAGISALDLSSVLITNYDASAEIAVTSVVDGQVCVGPNCSTLPPPTAPEPVSLLLFGVGGAALAASRLRRRYTA